MSLYLLYVAAALGALAAWKWLTRPVDGRDAVAIVCCYGVFADQHRTITEMRGYRAYLLGVAQEIIRRRIRYVVLCGGSTNPAFPVSEALSCRGPLEAFLDLLDPTHARYVAIELEGSSRNTTQNLARGLKLALASSPFDPKTVVVFTDRARWPKGWVLAHLLYQRNVGGLFDHAFRFRVVGVPREDIHPNSRLSVQLLQATSYLFLPALVRGELMAGITGNEENLSEECQAAREDIDRFFEEGLRDQEGLQAQARALNHMVRAERAGQHDIVCPMCWAYYNEQKRVHCGG
ncbi:hypothetical protein HY375_03230 [Candidatus Berkelbacteria bacterium]|nr:hypothetical protein [Candidatus Berkelbacteria bacterium]